MKKEDEMTPLKIKEELRMTVFLNPGYGRA
jgi:hypothetical protein